MVVMDDDEGEVALELREREAHGLDEVALVVALDEMRDGLGVRLGAEGVPLGDEARSELAVVLDDSVQDDRELRRSQPASGWAFASVTPPCVAQRVCPRPVVAADPFVPARSFSCPRGPTART